MLSFDMRAIRHSKPDAPQGGTAARVKRLRSGAGLTQEQLAGRLLVTPLTVHRWESGQSVPRPLALDRLRQLEEELSATQATSAPSGDAPWSSGSPLRVREGPAATPPFDFAGDPDAVSAAAEALRLAYGHQFNPAFASEISRIDPLPHQRIAVYEHMLPQDPLRFLLADDAGAGKTIMTGLVVRDMLMRGRIRRVLIAPPAGLVGNWERELRTLFKLPFRIVTGADARSAATSRAAPDAASDAGPENAPGTNATTSRRPIPAGGHLHRTSDAGQGPGAQLDNPFGGPAGNLAIVSMDTLAGEGVFGALRDPGVAPYDLVVFDEAHKLAASTDDRRTRKTRRYQLAEALAGCPSPHPRYAGLGWAARHLLLLTATPHMGKDSPYHHLWRLLDPHVFATGEAFRRFPQDQRGRHFLRRTKEEMVDLKGGRLYRPRLCDTFSYELAPGPDGEQALYDATTDYLRHVYGQATGDGAARLAMGVFQRRLASSSWALLRSFERRAEKLAEAADALRSGALTLSDLSRTRQRLERRYPTDYFDAHGADEDVADRGSKDPGGPADAEAEAHEDFETAVLGAVISADIEDLEREIAVVNGLAAHAKAVVDSGRESKFEKLREVLDDPAHAAEKWLIFTEHRDTAAYLVRRLEGLGHAGRVATVHGGMAWPERERQVERFRDPLGARYLVATDAAGEGINLQFCAFMANYDIPWNPARLEQRMGRIHRYGQKRDVRIVNLVAGNTREGRVLQVLLEKLEAVRKELDSDKVFDVIGRLFEGASLKDYMAEALTGDEDERRVVARVGEALNSGRVRKVAEQDERAYGPPGDVAARLDGLRDDMERERYLQLLPGYVRRFVEKSAALLDLEVQGDLDGWFTLVPKRPGALDPLLPALEGYPAEIRARLCVRRGGPNAEDGIWLHPGEPVFDALREHVARTFATDALRGGIFIDARAKAPYFVHLALASVQQEPGAPPSNGQSLELPPDARPRVLEHRLLAVRHDAEGPPAETAATDLLLLQSAAHVPPGAVPLAARAIGMRAEAANCLEQVARKRLADARRTALEAELPDRRRRMLAGFDLRAAELASRRARLASKEDADAEAAEIRRDQKALQTQKTSALATLEAAPGRIAPGEVRFVVHALAVPPDNAGQVEQHDEQVEQIAVRIATAWERERGAEVQDVSKPALARAAGLANWPGFDLLARQPDGETRSIEVKGRAGHGPVQVALNEWTQACHLRDRYWLYVVWNCATPDPILVRVRNPFPKLLVGERASTTYAISPKSLLDAAERG